MHSFKMIDEINITNYISIPVEFYNFNYTKKIKTSTTTQKLKVKTRTTTQRLKVKTKTTTQRLKVKTRTTAQRLKG